MDTVERAELTRDELLRIATSLTFSVSMWHDKFVKAPPHKKQSLSNIIATYRILECKVEAIVDQMDRDEFELACSIAATREHYTNYSK